MKIMEQDDSTKMIGQGIILLLVIIIVGVMAAETQLNHLTKRAEFAQFMNVRHTTDHYCFYVFGNRYQVGAIQYIGEISNTDSQLIYQSGTKKLIIPTKLAISLDEIFAAAIRGKQVLLFYYQQLQEAIFYKIKVAQ